MLYVISCFIGHVMKLKCFLSGWLTIHYNICSDSPEMNLSFFQQSRRHLTGIAYILDQRVWLFGNRWDLPTPWRHLGGVSRAPVHATGAVCGAVDKKWRDWRCCYYTNTGGGKPQKWRYIENNVCTRVTNCFSECFTRVLFWHNESINDYKNDDLYTSSPCLNRSFFLLMASQLIVDDVTTNRKLWRDHVNNDI